MPQLTIPQKDLNFLLYSVFVIEKNLLSFPAFQEFSKDVLDAVLIEAAKFAEQVLFPLNQSGDREACSFHQEEVHLPKGFKEAYQQFIAGGWTSLDIDLQYGGQGLPHTFQNILEEMLSASNLSFSLIPSLSHGVSRGLLAHASEELKNRYLPALTSGRWTGVMCLTESHSGSDLGLIRTKATPDTNGTYLLSGTKIFITSGEHDAAENIIHLVLARLPDAPSGSKGISLFLAPKFLINTDGTLGKRNAIVCGAIEHKMGIKASPTCVMNYDNASAYLVGEVNQGLAAMFTIMNTERIAIGIEGVGLSTVAYENALNYAKERRQGRGIQSHDTADPIIVHTDVRRMLLTMKAYTEGCRALYLWASLLLDTSVSHPDSQQRLVATELVAFLTPIVKAFCTDCGVEVSNLGIQIYGGHGYISEWGMEQYARDARITQLYEGTNGIQAHDLIGRKLIRDEGRAFQLFCQEITDFAGTQSHPLSKLLQATIEKLKKAGASILAQAKNDPHAIGAHAVSFLRCCGLTSLGYLWLKMAISAAHHSDSFHQGKVETAFFYFHHILPNTESLFTIIEAGSRHLTTIASESF